MSETIDNQTPDQRVANVLDYRTGQEPALSVVVIGYQSPDTMKSCLDSLRQQTRKDFEVIIVDNGGSLPDDEWTQLLSVAAVQLQKNYLQLIARNIGATFARADTLLLLDEDSILAHDAIEQILDLFETTDVVVSRCRMLYRTDNLFNQVALHFDLGQKPLTGYMHENGMAIRTTVYFEFGGYDERLLPGGEYMYWLYHIGQNYGVDNVVYCPGAVLWTDYSHSFRHILRKNWIHAKGVETVRALFPEFVEFQQQVARGQSREWVTLDLPVRLLDKLRRLVHQCGKRYYRIILSQESKA